MGALSLSPLDALTPYELDPQVWAANLTAIAAESETLAERFRATEIPCEWRAARALDGSPTWRLEAPGEPPRWLGDAAAPRVRAEALLAGVRLGDSNFALPAVGTGAELDLLLPRLQPQQAVYVFERDPLRMAAVLRVRDLTDAIARGRCVILPPDGELDHILALLGRWPGMLLPGTLLNVVSAGTGEVRHAQHVCEIAARAVGQRRAETLSSLRQAIAQPPPVDGTLRLALLALGGRVPDVRRARELASATERLGWSAALLVGDDPRRADPVFQCQQLASFGPTLMLSVGHDVDALPASPSVPALRLVSELIEALRPVGRAGARLLAASPRIGAALRAAGAAPERVVDFWHAAPQALLDAEVPIAAAGPLVFVADRPDSRASACGIEQPTHKRLWKALRARITERWDTLDVERPAELLRSAESECGLELGGDSLREQMLRLIKLTLIPSVVAERILRLLLAQADEVLLVGTGWRNDTPHRCRLLAEDPGELEPRMLPPVCAALSSQQSDPLSETLIAAAALGWPLIVFRSGRSPSSGEYGGVIDPARHAMPATASRELAAAITSMRREHASALKRAERLREHLRREHTYERRLRQLALVAARGT
ncbi:MAG: glycosyltransferase family 1 protein [Phycisphaerae bacterium]|jgi:hypothetical protein